VDQAFYYEKKLVLLHSLAVVAYCKVDGNTGSVCIHG